MSENTERLERMVDWELFTRQKGGTDATPTRRDCIESVAGVLISIAELPFHSRYADNYKVYAAFLRSLIPLVEAGERGRDSSQLVKAAEQADWGQVVCNGGPPCFHVEEDGSFCLRAERWCGHNDDHRFVSLAEMLQARNGEGK